MASGITTAFWGMTINNYDETDLAMVQNGYPDYLREIVHTLEEGEEGTPHIQAWIKLQRQQRLSFVKKLFPRGHFKPLTSDQYVANTKVYAQKLDDTAVAAAVHRFNDPYRTIESVVKEVILEMRRQMAYEIYDNSLLTPYRKIAEKKFVERDHRYAKLFVSATYKQMWKEFGPAMYSCIVSQDTHTHTHDDEKFSVAEGITDDDGEDEGSHSETASEGSEQESEDHEDGETSEDEGFSEGSGDECSESDSESQE